MEHSVKTIPGTWYTITATAPATVIELIQGEIATLATLKKSGTDSFRPSTTQVTINTEGKFTVLPTKAPGAPFPGTGGNVQFTDEQAEQLQTLAEHCARTTSTSLVVDTPVCSMYSGSSVDLVVPDDDAALISLRTNRGSDLRELTVRKDTVHMIPLHTKTALGADAYGLSVSVDGGLQLWGTHFLQGDAHADNTLKIVHNSLSLGSTDTAALGFDYANTVTFRTFPNDGSTANDSAGGVYRFEAWQWADDSHTSKVEMPVDVRKPNAGVLCDESLLNRAEVLAAIEENAPMPDLPLVADTRISDTPPTVSTPGGMALGYGASAIGVASTALGVDASADGTGSVAIGRGAKTLNGDNSVAIGHQANATATFGTMYTTAVGAETLAESSYSTALGAKASAKGGATAVGTKAQATGTDSTALGYNAKASGTVCSTALGKGAAASGSSATALGSGATANADGATAVGRNARANAKNATALGCFTLASSAASTAVGYSTQVNDIGVTAIGNFEGTNAQYQTLLYLIGANSPLATTYEGGAACLGYVVKDTNGNIIECGTRKLSELLTNNTAFAPASMDLDAPAPTPFMPTGITDPIEFPEELENEPEILTDTTQQ